MSLNTAGQLIIDYPLYHKSTEDLLTLLDANVEDAGKIKILTTLMRRVIEISDKEL